MNIDAPGSKPAAIAAGDNTTDNPCLTTVSAADVFDTDTRAKNKVFSTSNPLHKFDSEQVVAGSMSEALKGSLNVEVPDSIDDKSSNTAKTCEAAASEPFDIVIFLKLLGMSFSIFLYSNCYPTWS